MIDVVGHFGSHLSYATVADRVSRALIDKGVVGTITNLDDRMIDVGLTRAARSRCSEKVVLLSDPQGYMVDALVEQYGGENVAIFLCPNTSSISAEHISSVKRTGRVYTPSNWCADTILRCVPDAHITVMPLGVDDVFVDKWTGPVSRLQGHPVSFLHVTTDSFWPGRKGTEELLCAWKALRQIVKSPTDAHLTIHCLPQLYPRAYDTVAALGLLDDIALIPGESRGITPERLYNLIADCDVLVAPSRSEGFGIMPLSALCAGRAVCTTSGTGQDEYLFGEVRSPDWLAIPTFHPQSMAGEYGDAPTVVGEQIVPTLLAAMQMAERNVFSETKNRALCSHWSWKARASAWADSLIEWKEEENV